MADNRITEASWDLINSWRETNQLAANSMVAIQDFDLKFAQNIFLNGVEVLERQEEIMSNLTQGLQQQGLRQQSAFEKLVNATMDMYAGYWHTLFSFYRSIGDSTQNAVQQGVKYAQDATRQAMETAANAARQGAEQVTQDGR
ncbi:MAG TPA: hypothetical protein VKV40_23630 [Ktedonobacteraceae bacterium]|nr:hypothetical protein [Ktedonobacteraceae bacterium]